MADDASSGRRPISDRLEEVLDRVLDLPPDERSDAIDTLCADDPTLRRDVRELLAADARAGALLPCPSVAAASDAAPARPGSSGAVGRRYGNCTVTRLIAAGGMGVVFLARQDRPERDVAVKVIRGGLVTDGMRRRFELEAAVLARLQHPGIAEVHEVGVADGEEPYIVMEHVDGHTLLDHAEREALDPGERAELLARTCDAIAHAHRSGVVHRDLKPGNILVTADGQPKVLDFGVARVTDGAGTSHTRTGQLIGTVQYMSPEQISGRPHETDPRTDVYALGVLGFELFTGRLPYDFRTPMVHDMVRIIETEEPTRLGHVDAALRGDLETIIAKALEKDHDRRYRSAEALAEDLRRWRRHQPILARPASAAYRVAKFVRRNRTLCASVAALVLVLASATVVSTALLVRIRQSGERLAAHLRTSNIERGRLLARDGQIDVAEFMLWDELLDVVAAGGAPPRPGMPGDPAYRHARWALWELYHEHPCRRTITGERGPVTAVAWHPHEARLAWADADGLATLDVDGADPRRLPTPAPGPVGALVFDTAGRLACGLDDGRVFVLDETGQAWAPLPIAPGPAVTALAFAPGDDRLAAGAKDGRVHLVDLRRGALVATFAEHDAPINGVGFDPDGRVLVTGCERRVIEHDLVSGRVTRAPAAGAIAPDLQAGFAMRGGRVATASARRVELARPERRVLVHGHTDRVMRLAFVGDDRLVTAGRDRTLRIIDLSTGAERLLRGHVGVLERLAASPTDDLVVAGYDDLKIWDVTPAPGWTRLPTTDRGPHAVAFDPRGRSLAASGATGSVELWDPSTRQRVRTLWPGGPDERPVPAIALDVGRETLHAANYDGTVRSFDLAGRRPPTIRTHPGGASCLALSPDGATLACGGGETDPHIRLWTLDSDTPPRELHGHTRRIPAVRFAPDGGTLASVSIDGTVRLWDTRSGAAVTTIRAPTHARAVAFSPDGKRLAYGTDHGEVVVLGADGRGPQGVLDVGTSRVFALAFSRDGRLLASAVQEGTVTLWDGPTLRPLATIDSGARPPLGIAFDTTGRRLAVGGDPGRLAVLDLRYFDPHIAGNAAAQIARWRQTRPDAAAAAAEAWAANAP